jgi:hypothetical protein
LGNELVPIATIPHEVALYFGLADENLHSGKAYFIDYAANHPEVTLDEYEKIQEVIEDYDDIKELKRRVSQVSTGHDSPLNATSFASKGKLV